MDGIIWEGFSAGDVCRHDVVEAQEVGFGHHHGVAKTAEVCHVFDFFCEYVAGVNDARGVLHNGTTVGAYLTDFGFS